MLERLSSIGTVYDIFKKNHDFHPYTFGYNGENLKHYDQVLTAKEDYGSFQTLDYMFEIIPFKITQDDMSNIALPIENQDSSIVEVDYTSSQIEHFLISNKPYQQLSDHFGLSVCLKSNFILNN